MSLDKLFLGEYSLLKEDPDLKLSSETIELIEAFAKHIEVTPENIGLSLSEGYVLHYKHNNVVANKKLFSIDDGKLEEIKLKFKKYEFISNNYESNKQYKIVVDDVTDFANNYGIYFFIYMRDI